MLRAASDTVHSLVAPDNFSHTIHALHKYFASDNVLTLFMLDCKWVAAAPPEHPEYSNKRLSSGARQQYAVAAWTHDGERPKHNIVDGCCVNCICSWPLG